MSMSDLFHQYVGQAYDKQVYLADSIGIQHQWAFDIQSGTVTFNKRLSFTVQILGTHSTEANTWLWAWANTESNLPPRLVSASQQLKIYGAENNLTPLTEAEFTVTDELNGTVLSTIASGVCRADCSYRGSYPGGELYLLIQDDTFIRKVSDPIGRMVRLFPEMLTVMPISDPRRALRYYAEGYGVDVQEAEHSLLLRAENGRTARALFDERGQFTGMET